ncbi:hypothetical protein D7D52_26820 [Nocardia yunnanensis]|uniref:PASTA domain-containing protein n=1 Tax=Nocardia yunnanensis TaxID=2382165 RepID=A0A386ZPP3_9NOCA|nr:hypothetical protein D7D52_26820 [Nocardia yunnanensis]
MASSARRFAVLAGLPLVLAGCGAQKDAAHPVTTTVKITPPSITATTTPVSTPTITTAPELTTPPPTILTPQAGTTTTPAASGATAVMPNVVCMNLQDAQNKIHQAGVFYSRSKDATGKGRHQVLDRNWIVIAQNLAPGTPFGEGDAILSVVKYGEPNNC